MNKKTIRDVDVKGKRVFVRVDFNVPLEARTRITDDTRIQGAMPTIRYLLDHGAALVLASHLGRPKSGPEAKFSLAPTAKRLQELLPHNQVIMAADCIGPEVDAQKQALQPGQVLVLENVRFYKGEQKGDMDFAKALASYHRRLRGRRLWHRPPPGHERGRRAARSCGPRASRWWPASCWRKRSSSWARRSRTRCGPSWPSWAAPRSRTRSTSSRTCWARSMPC